MIKKSDFKHEYLFVLGNGASIASADLELNELLRCTPSIENFVPLMERISQVNQKNPCELSSLMDDNHLDILIKKYAQKVIEISTEKGTKDIIKLLACLMDEENCAGKKIDMSQSKNNNLLPVSAFMRIDEDINVLIGMVFSMVGAYYKKFGIKYFSKLWQIVQKTKSPVVSLNWDINFEKVIYEETKIPMKNYYGKCAFGCLHPDEKSYSFNPIIDILKPHGSLNWCFIDQPDNGYHLNISNDFDRSASADYVFQYLSFLIPPMPENEVLYFYSNRYWKKKTLIKEDIFSRIREYAASARTLVIIGYSFPNNDEHIKELFTNYRFENVLVFDTSEEVFLRIKGFFPEAKPEFRKGGFADIMNWPDVGEGFKPARMQ